MDKLKSLYIDGVCEVQVDDFLVAVGVKKSNSVYHVAEVTEKPSPSPHFTTRYHMKVYKSDLITALRREPGQRLHPFRWYKRNNNNL